MQWCEQREITQKMSGWSRMRAALHSTELDQINVEDLDLTLLHHQGMASPYKCK